MLKWLEKRTLKITLKRLFKQTVYRIQIKLFWLLISLWANLSCFYKIVFTKKNFYIFYKLIFKISNFSDHLFYTSVFSEKGTKQCVEPDLNSRSCTYFSVSLSLTKIIGLVMGNQKFQVIFVFTKLSMTKKLVGLFKFFLSNCNAYKVKHNTMKKWTLWIIVYIIVL